MCFLSNRRISFLRVFLCFSSFLSRWHLEQAEGKSFLKFWANPTDIQARNSENCTNWLMGSFYTFLANWKMEICFLPSFSPLYVLHLMRGHCNFKDFSNGWDLRELQPSKVCPQNVLQAFLSSYPMLQRQRSSKCASSFLQKTQLLGSSKCASVGPYKPC